MTEVHCTAHVDYDPKSIKKYTFDNGKYEVQAADDGSSLKAYRHGEFWQNMIGDNLTVAMLNRIDELSDKIKEQGQIILDYRVRAWGNNK